MTKTKDSRQPHVALSGGTFNVMQRDGYRPDPAVKGRKISVATGTAGSRQVARTAMADSLYRVSNETELVGFFDLDQREEGNLIRAIPTRTGLLYIAGQHPGQAVLPFGLNGVPLLEQAERRGLWHPPCGGFTTSLLTVLSAGMCTRA